MTRSTSSTPKRASSRMDHAKVARLEVAVDESTTAFRI